MGDEVSDSENEDDIGEREFNSHCGLRTISEKVLQVLLEKRRTTYKEVSDFITNSEAQRLNLIEFPLDQRSFGGKNPAQDKKNRVQKENNRKRIKNLRRRVYDSLNVFLACNIFTKDRKKVTLNMDFYEYLPDDFKQNLPEEFKL